MNRPQHAEIHKRCFIIIIVIIIAVSYDSSPKVTDSNLPQVCLEKLEQNTAKGAKENSRYGRLMEHVVYTGLQQC